MGGWGYDSWFEGVMYQGQRKDAEDI